MVSHTLLAFTVLMMAAVLVWRQDRRAAIHRLPRSGVVLIACLSLTLLLQRVLHHPVEEGSAVVGFVLTSVLLAGLLPRIRRIAIYVLGAALLLVTPIGVAGLVVAVAGLAVAVPLKLTTPAGARQAQRVRAAVGSRTASASRG
ncbi:hypothetical protein [Flindersiella endophytica]